MRAIGVEEEFLLVSDSGDRLISEGDDVAGAADRATPEEQQVDHELKRAQVETGTAPSTSLVDVDEQVRRMRAELAAAASCRGARVAALGTWPLAGGSPTTPDERYVAMTARFGVLARQQLTCGQHVHVDVADRNEAVRVIDGIRSWLPVLRAISANSPYWQGEDSGYASYRSVLWGQWPTAGPTAVFGSVERYDQVVRALIATGAAMDEAMIYFDARVSVRYPTVEIRIADVCGDAGDAVLIAGLCRGLVETAADPGMGLEPAPLELLRAATWRAARFGVSDELSFQGLTRPAAEALGALVDAIRPALARAGDLDLVEAGIHRVLTRGTGADRQRASFARTGDLRDVVLDACEQTLA
jgi:carboxylate-amine ligase